MSNKILVLGDTIIDSYMYGTVTRVCPEAPVPVLQLEKTTFSAGGAANVAANLSALGADYLFYPIVGDDHLTNIIVNLLRELSIAKWFVTKSISNTTKTRIIAQNNHYLTRLDSDNTKRLNPEDEEIILKDLAELFDTEEFEYLILADYNKGAISYNLEKQISNLCVQYNIKLLVDTKKESLFNLTNVFLVTPNEQEAKRLMYGHNYHVHNWLITKGKDGMELFHGGKHIDISAIPVISPDVSGAGDTVIATMADSLQRGYSMTESARRARVAAAIVVAKFGTATCSAKELNDFLTKGYNKLYTTYELINEVALWKQEGHSITFTNGCFDGLHVGHIDLIKETKALKPESKLIVALNSNESVARLKGEGRPINLQRHVPIAAMPEVDAVVYFEDEDLLQLITEIGPNLFTKGEDYKDQVVVGRGQVEATGGEFHLIKFNNHISTTKIVT